MLNSLSVTPQTGTLKRLDTQPSLARSAQDAIRDYILNNRLPPGSDLPPETELVKQLGISRNSVREAVKALSALGMIEVRRGSGLFVGNFSLEPLLESLSYNVWLELDTLAELLTVRRVLEVGMIDHAITQMQPADHERLKAILARMKAKAEISKEFPEEDREFHRCLFLCLDNKVLLKVLDTFWLTLRRAIEQLEIANVNVMHTYHDHAEIAHAIFMGDVVNAKLKLDQHYTDVTNRIDRARKGKKLTQ
jgi:DNA-binding FadR family transcriptional regulator